MSKRGGDHLFDPTEIPGVLSDAKNPRNLQYSPNEGNSIDIKPEAFRGFP